MHRSIRLLPILLAAALPAQGPAPAAVSQPVITAEHFLVPLHTAPSGSSDDEVWAGAASYKASFHDGFVFYPFLGPTYDGHRPLRWTTEAVLAGGETLAEIGLPPRTHRTDWRYEYRWPGVTEAYDVRADGVEQTFVIAERPAADGDLVVVGRITTPLRADAVDSAHGDLVFRDRDGTPLVRYGAAFAIDAIGRRTAVTTTFDGQRVQLRVGGDWLRGASFPVTVDPLTSRVVIAERGLIFSTTSGVDIGQDGSTSASALTMMTVYSRAFNRTDHDVYAQLRDASHGGSWAIVYSSLTTVVDRLPRVGFVGGANRWVIALGKGTDPDHLRDIYCYFHDRNNTVLNSGVQRQAEIGTFDLEEIDVGGRISGTRGLIVFTRQGQPAQRSYGISLDAAARTVVGQAIAVASANVHARMRVCVNPFAGTASDPWVVAWHQETSPGSHAVAASLIGVDGRPLQSRTLLTSGSDFYDPKVAGMDGKYMLAFTRTNPFSVQTRRLDWTTSSYALHPARTVETRLFNGPLDLAFDRTTRSHWGLTYDRWESLFPSGQVRIMYAQRLGPTGGALETTVVASGSNDTVPSYPRIAFDRASGAFALAFGQNDSPNRHGIYACHLIHPPDATVTRYGTSCGGSIGAASAPLIGTESWQVTLSRGSLLQPAALLLGAASARVPLNPIGMGSCELSVNPTVLATLPALIDAGGRARVQLPLGDYRTAPGDLYLQWFYLSPGSNTLGALASGGMKAQVR